MKYLLIVLLLGTHILATEPLSQLDARAILEKNLALKTPVNYGARYHIVHNDHQGRQKKREALLFFGANQEDVRNQQSLLYFLAPKDLAGQASLTSITAASGEDYASKSWVYNPLFRQVRLNSISNWRNRRFGSSLTVYDSLLPNLDWYQGKIAAEETYNGYQTWKLALEIVDKKVQERSGYAKLEQWIDKKSLQIVATTYYDRKGEKEKTIENQYEQMGAFWILTQLKATLFRSDGKEEITHIKVDNFVFDMDLNFTSFFSKNTLKRGVPLSIRKRIPQ